MKLRDVKIDKKFIPAFKGNKDLPASEQVIIYFNRIPGTSEKRDYISLKHEHGGAIQLVYNDSILVSTLVSKIDNLELSNGEKIKDGLRLSQVNCPALEGLFSEIREYLFPIDEELSEGESIA